MKQRSGFLSIKDTSSEMFHVERPITEMRSCRKLEFEIPDIESADQRIKTKNKLLKLRNP